MMQSGLSRELFECWCTDKRNGVIIAGYSVEGTLAKVKNFISKIFYLKISLDDFI
jgi:Cft2 family RNA processing exonuclease